MAFTSGLDPILLAMEEIENNNCDSADLYSLTATATTENNCIEFIESDKMTIASTIEVELVTEISESDNNTPDSISSVCCTSNDVENFNGIVSSDKSNDCSTKGNDDQAEQDLAKTNVSVVSADESNQTAEIKYTKEGIKSLLTNKFSSDEVIPFKNGFVMYIMSIENYNITKASKHLMDVASRKNIQFNFTSLRNKVRTVYRKFSAYKVNIRRSIQKIMAYLEEPFTVPEPGSRKTVRKSTIEMETVAVQQPLVNARVLKSDCEKCTELRASLRECTSLLKNRLKDSRNKLKQTKSIEMRRLNQSLKRKSKIIFKLKTERGELRKNNSLLCKKRDKLKADLRSDKLPGRQPRCKRRHEEDYQKIIRSKNKRIKELESVIDDLQCQIETTMLEN